MWAALLITVVGVLTALVVSALLDETPRYGSGDGFRVD